MTLVSLLEAFAGTYIIVQIWANTFGLTVMFVLNNIIDRDLSARGYEKLPVTTSDKVSNVVAGVIKFIIIPLYYCIVAIDLVSDNSSFENLINERIKSGRYIPKVEKPKPEVKKENVTEFLKIESLPMVQEHYKASSNKGSLYEMKPEVRMEFTGELETPEINKVNPFASKASQVKNDTSIEDAKEILSKLSPEQRESIFSAYGNHAVDLDEVRQVHEHSYIFDNNNKAA